jgi:hypothetical protein
MAMIRSHLGVALQCLGDSRIMGQVGQDRPDHPRQTQKRRQDPSPDDLPCPQHESLPETVAARLQCRLVLSSPEG